MEGAIISESGGGIIPEWGAPSSGISMLTEIQFVDT